MKVIHSPVELRRSLHSYSSTAVVGLVPTMGNLHEGHLELVRRARKDCDVIVTSIFVNPLQFSAHEDFEGYPRTFEADCELLRAHDVEILFCPNARSMYPRGQEPYITLVVPHLGDTLCGEHRPGHFDGVATVVAKLFNLVQPNKAYFGEKDWQQFIILRTMVADINFPIEVIGVPTVRDADDLAISSRNQYLNEEQRHLAPLLFQQLCTVRDSILAGNTNYPSLEQQAKTALVKKGFRPDYVSVCNADTLEIAHHKDTNRRVFGAAYLGQARLIDNIAIDST